MQLRELVCIGIAVQLAGLFWLAGPGLLGQTTAASVLGTITNSSGAMGSSEKGTWVRDDRADK